MKTTSTLRYIISTFVFFLVSSLQAQDLVITNARILDGNGGDIANGTVVVRDGRITQVAAGTQTVAGIQTIDADGKTVMPGFVEGHRHVITGNPATWLSQRAPQQMQEFLDAGFTTVLAAIDPPPIIAARENIKSGTMQGPRLFAGAILPVAAPVPNAPPPQPGDPARTDPARGNRATQPAPAVPRAATIAAVAAAKKAGYDYLKAVVNTSEGGPEIETLALIVEEGKKVGMPTIVHAVSVQDAAAVIDAHPAMLVHTPHIGRLDEDQAALQKIAGAKIPMTSTLAVFLPHFDPNGIALFRDAEPFPWHTLSSAGQGPVNARLLWNAGVVYGYGTDTQWPPKESLADELRALRIVFSPAEVVTILTKNAAIATMHGDEFGTLAVGKYGDLVIVEGDPMQDSSALLHVVTTIKEGKVVFDSGQ